jgi:hypothetical protein
MDYMSESAFRMPERFAIAVQWPDDSRPYLVHLQKPYFVAEARRHGGMMLFISTLTSMHLRTYHRVIGELMFAASAFFADALGVSAQTTNFLKGNHGHEFPRFLMARTAGGETFIVEPDHPTPVVELRQPKPGDSKPSKQSTRFDTVTQWRLAHMRKYYQHFLERQKRTEPTTLVVPALR